MLDCIIDISRYQGKVDFRRVRKDGIEAVFMKGSEGLHYTDAGFKTYHRDALAAGLLCGAYHFGREGDGHAQADHFLRSVDRVEHDELLLVLDLEWAVAGTQKKDPMSLQQVEAFVRRLWEVTGRWPGVYTSASFLHEYRYLKSDVLGNCWLWLAQYSSHPPAVPAIWAGQDWTLWQYTERARVDGVHTRCDRDKFKGSLADLYRLWQLEWPHAARAFALNPFLVPKLQAMSRLFESRTRHRTPFIIVPGASRHPIDVLSHRHRYQCSRINPTAEIVVRKLSGGPGGPLAKAIRADLAALLGPSFEVVLPDPNPDGVIRVAYLQ